MDWETLSEKLRSMGMILAKDELPRPDKKQKHPIETIVPGEFIETIHGQVFCLTQSYPIDYAHGSINIFPQNSFTHLAQYAKAPHITLDNLQNIVFLDTETTGLAGGTGTLPFMVGAGRFQGDSFVLSQFFMRHPGEEAALLAALDCFLTPLDAVVTYNGKTYDIPLLNTRYTIQGFSTPFTDIAHFDLLMIARRLWRDKLPDCSLGTIETEILGLSRTDAEVPGYLIPEMYLRYLRTQDARPMQGIFYHNAVDILSLAALLTHATDLLAAPFEKQSDDAIDLASMGKLFEFLGDEKLAAALYEHSIQQDLPDGLYWKTLKRFAFLYKRRKDYPSALPLWEKAAQADKLYAFEELAKYYEHKKKDYPQAIQWVNAAFASLAKLNLFKYEYQDWSDRLSHRLQRLMRKNKS